MPECGRKRYLHAMIAHLNGRSVSRDPDSNSVRRHLRSGEGASEIYRCLAYTIYPFLGYEMSLKLLCSPSGSQNLNQDIYIQEGAMSFTCPKRQSNAMRSNARPSCQYVCTAVGQSPIPLPKKDTQTRILVHIHLRPTKEMLR
jgi:hypothetical protein